ncbi:MAG: glutamate racemase [Flavobacteriales bacterium]|nr:glutamate racemase [Flavobacteriales bacterium]
MNKDNPIGIFDSGIGGLTVAKAIRSLLPHESLLYFGDTKHLPYGEKSAHAIQEFSKNIALFLKQKNCKMIVIACNTASSVAYDTIKNECPDIEIVNVIDPIVNRITTSKDTNTIGVIGTKGTINSDVYPQKIKSINRKIIVKSLATPLLAAMIEEGFFNDKISQAIVHNYLKDPALEGIDKLILACTHYPLIYEVIRDFYPKEIEIIDSASHVALHIKDVLSDKQLLAHQSQKHKFYVSDYTLSFEKSAKFFFGEDIHLEEVSSIH